MDDAEVTFAIPCDSVRQEINGKFIIVGMYTEAFVPFTLPQQIEMTFFIWARAAKEGEYKIELDLYVEPMKEPLANLGVDFITGGPTTNAGIGLPPITIPISEPGAIVLKAGRDRKEILRLPITAPPSSSATQPPSEQSQPASQG